MPLYRKVGIKVINAANNLSSDLDIKDTQSGFRAFSKLAIEKLRFESEGMELSLEMLNDAHEKNLKITEVPVDIRYDVPKSSSFTAFSHGLTVLLYAMMTLSHKKTSSGSRDTRSHIIRYLRSYGAQSSIRFH